MRAFLPGAAAALIIASAPSGSAFGQAADQQPGRFAVGGSLHGFAPQGEFAKNVDFAGGAGAHMLVRLDPQGVAAFRADLGFLIYGHESYRVPLGGGPLGLINIDVNTTNSIFDGGVGLQLMMPSRRVRPYGNVSAGFSYFVTSSSAEGSGNEESFASSTNYDDGGFAWTAGGGLYIPLSTGRTIVNLDIGVRWVDNGRREYLRDDGITFENNDVQLSPVRTEAKGILYMLGVTVVPGPRVPQ